MMRMMMLRMIMMMNLHTDRAPQIVAVQREAGTTLTICRSGGKIKRRWLFQMVLVTC